MMDFDDPLADIDTESASMGSSAKKTSARSDDEHSESTPPRAPEEEDDTSSDDIFSTDIPHDEAPRSRPSSGGREFADEVFSKKISAKFRTFFIDLKQSKNGKFVKISEKSRGGQKSTIMMDAEDVPEFIQALTEVQSHL